MQHRSTLRAVPRRVRVLLLLAPAAVFIGCGDDTGRAEQAHDAAKAAGLSEEVADFFASATSGIDATYRVSYATTDDAGKPIQFTVTQHPPDRRVDIFRADGSIDTTLVSGGKRYQCTKTGDAWQCGELTGTVQDPGTAFDPDVLQATIDRLTASADAYDFRVESRRIAGADGRCLVTTLKPGQASAEGLGAAGTLCLAPEGPQLLVDTPRGKIEAREYSTDLPADAFSLPAQPQSTSPAPPPST